jgi:hypothetical protein
MKYKKIFLILLVILKYKKTNTVNLDTINIIENCIFNNKVLIENNCNINNININGLIEFSDVKNSKNIIINFNNSDFSEFLIYNLPIIIDPISIHNNLLIGIDNKNKLYLDSSNFIENTLVKNTPLNDTLNVINIDTFDINQTNNSLPLISSINKDGNPITISIGNKNNNIIFVSPIVLSINNLIFNNTINYGIGVSNNADVNTNSDIIVGQLFINNNIIKNDSVTLTFQDFIVSTNLNINSNNTVIIQGNILFKNNLTIGNTQTNLTIYTREDNTIDPVSFLGIDANQNLCITYLPPALKNLNTNQVKSNSNNLTIIPINNTIQIGNVNSNITINSDILLQNTWEKNSDTNDVNFIFNNKNTFQSPVKFNQLDNAFYIIPNNELSINANINFNAVSFNRNIYFPNLPTINNVQGYITIAIENDIAYLTITPITHNSEKLHTIEKQFHSNNQEIYKDLKSIENKIEKKISQYTQLKNIYTVVSKNYIKNIKKFLFYLKIKKNKNNVKKSIHKKLQKLKQELL